MDGRRLGEQLKQKFLHKFQIQNQRLRMINNLLSLRSKSNKMLSFSKLVGTGNDFIFIDLADQPLRELTKRSPQEIAKNICDRHKGVGADGLIFVQKASDPEKLKWDFYNRDASAAEFCGNAARCFGRWVDHYYKRDVFVFESLIGQIKVQKLVENDMASFCVYFVNLKAAPTLVDLRLAGRESASEVFAKLEKLYFLNSGVPHFVCHLKEDLNKEQRLKIVSHLRFHKIAGVAGANVSFLFEDQTQSFERGVEDFTLSCGTGVLASASCIWKEKQQTEIVLNTPGGQLRVEIVKTQGESILEANLIGPAEFICEGQWNMENL